LEFGNNHQVLVDRFISNTSEPFYFAAINIVELDWQWPL